MTREQAIEQAKVLNTIIQISELSTILENFITPFNEKTVLKADGCHYLYGNFNLGGTLSGRLSSSKVNLQNLPSDESKTYAVPVKECFIAPPGWLMLGADFSSLEDKISALTTKDPNKIKVYTDGYDGHCLRAFNYFGDQMPDIIDTIESINSIEDKYPNLRQKSKGPTFCLTYQGTFKALMGLGFSRADAKAIEAGYHKLYTISDEWVRTKLIEASKCGYLTIAFGLRLRTPILSQTLLNTRSTPYEAQAESRTAGNALGQSYGMLNNRSAIELQNRVLASKYKYDIKPTAHIHDAQYFLVRDDVNVVKFLIDNLIECMQWQKLPELQHDIIKLGGECKIFHPNWAQGTKIPNNASIEDILNLFK